MTLVTQGEKSLYSDKAVELGRLLLDPSSATPSASSVMSDSFKDAATGRLKDVAIGRVTKEAGRVLGIFSIVTDLAIDKIGDHFKETKDNRAALLGIEEFSKKNIPGMAFKETDLDGTKYRIGVDASTKMAITDVEPRIIIEAEDQRPSFHGETGEFNQSTSIDLKHPALIAQIDAMKNAATAGVEAYKQDVAAKLPEEKKKYREAMMKHLEEIDAADADKVTTLTPPENTLGVEKQYTALIAESVDNTRAALMQNNRPNAPAVAQSGPQAAQP